MPEKRSVRDWSRRDFISATAAGVTLAACPRFLASCGHAAVVPPVAGAGGVQPGYFARFGVSDALMARVLGRAMGKGGDYADLFFQHNLTHYVQLEDGKVDRAYTQVELGCGVRVLKGDQTGYAFSEDLSEAALLSAAATAAAIADGPATPGSQAIRRIIPHSYYHI